jgi:hypothetical protein
LVVDRMSDFDGVGVPGSPLVLTRTEADRLLDDVGSGTGVFGVDIDAMLPMPDGAPPMSSFIAAWVSSSPSTGAQTALAWMGDQVWSNAPEIRFPNAVLALFSNDMAALLEAGSSVDADTVQIDPDQILGGELVADTTEDASAAGADVGDATGRGPVAFRAKRAGGPCSDITGFIDNAFASLVNALHVKPVGGSDFFSSVANGFITIFNVAIGLAAGLVRGLVDQITEPIFRAIQFGIASIGMATQFVSLFRDTTLTIKVAPSGLYRFAVGAEADISGQFVASSKSLTGDWPPELVDCAQATNVPLPTAVGKGTAANWTIEQSTPVIFTTTTATKVLDDFTARLDFVTGRESEEDQKGTESITSAFAEARILRNDVDQLLQFGRNQASSAKGLLASAVPFPVRPLAEAALGAIIDPLLARVDAEISGAAAGMFTLAGKQLVFVKHHAPPDTTTTAPPSSSSTPSTSEPDDEFCRLFHELAVFSVESDLDVVPWATEIVRRTDEMAPLAPADLVDDVAVIRRVYQAVADQDDITVLITSTEPLPDAAAAIGALCGPPPGG